MKKLTDADFGASTNVLYRHLWDRTAAELRQELGLTKRKQELRDYMGEYALLYTAITEKACADLLNRHGKEEVEIIEAMEIVRKVALMIHEQARQLSEFLKIDLVTEKPLLPGGGKAS